MDFNINLNDQKKLLKIYKKAPQQFERAMVGFVNTYAFKARSTQIEEIHRTMTIRNPRFVSSSIGVEKARYTGNIRNIIALTGAKTKDRSDAFVSQELGTKSKRKKTINQDTARNSSKSQVRARVRVRRTGRFNNYKKFQKSGVGKSGRAYTHKTKNQAMVSMIIATRKGLPGAKKPFEIKTKGTGMLANFKAGVYERNGTGLTRAQRYGKSPARSGKNRWHGMAIKIAIRRIDKTKVWGKEIKRTFRI